MLRIQVVRRDGVAVAGIPIRAWLHLRDRPAVDTHLGTTGGPDGSLDCDVGRLHARWQRIHGALPQRCVLRPELIGIGREDGIEVDPASPPPLVRLPMPATGRLVVRLQHAGGEPIRQHGSLRAAVHRASGSPDPFVLRQWSRDAAPVELPCAAIGAVVRIAASVEGIALPVATVAGPAAEGQVVPAAIRAPPSQPTLHGRVVLPDGTPAAATLGLRIRGPEGAPDGDAAYTPASGDDGGFECLIDADWVGRTPRSIRVQIGSARGFARLRSTTVLGHPFAPGRNGLGDVVLGEAPLIAGGTVADAAGTPQQPGRLGVIDLDRFEAAEPGSGRAPPRRRDASLEWVGGGGAFEIRGWDPQARIALFMPGDDTWATLGPVPVRRGERDLHLVLQRAAAVRIRVRHDLPADCRDLLLVALRPLRPAGAIAHRGRWQDARHVAWAGVPSGEYAVESRLFGDRDPFHTGETLAVAAGARVERQVDLRRHLRTIRIRVVGGDGTPVSGGTLTLPDGDVVRTLSFADGVVSLPVAAEGRLFTVAVPGHRSRRFEGVTQDLVARLAIAGSVLLRLDHPPVPAGLRLRVRLQPTEVGQRNPIAALTTTSHGTVEGTRTAGGAFAFRVSELTDHRLVVDLESAGAVREVRLATTPAVLRLGDDGSGPFTARIDAEHFATALERLR